MFEGLGSNNEYDYQRAHDQGSRNQGNDEDTTPACRKFTPDDVVLGFEIPMETDEQDKDGYGDKGSAERLSNVSKSSLWGVDERLVTVIDCGVEAEELGYCYAYGGE